MAPQRSLTDLAALVSRVAQEWRQRSGRQVEVVVEPVVAWVDSAKIERGVENLLANAARHTTADIPVWVKVARRSEGVLLAVEDAGGGVPQELRAILFEPFRQGPGAAAHAPGAASASPWWPASPSSTAGGRGCRTDQAAARRSKSCSQTRRPRSCQRPGHEVTQYCRYWRGSCAALAAHAGRGATTAIRFKAVGDSTLVRPFARVPRYAAERLRRGAMARLEAATCWIRR